MKKADVIDLVKYHYADNELEFNQRELDILYKIQEEE